jgi:hypothetical protein
MAEVILSRGGDAAVRLRATASAPAASPPMLAQWPPTLVMGGPAATTAGYTTPLRIDERQSSTAKRRSPRSRTVVTPAARRRRRLCSMTAAMASWPGSPIRSRVPVGSVGAQVDVRVDQPRQHRAAGHVQHLAAIRRRAR